MIRSRDERSLAQGEVLRATSGTLARLDMVSGPVQPIPEATQPHVDRLVGTTLGEHRIEQRVTEGRWGTIYRGAQVDSAKPVTIEVLRTGVTGNDEEAKAVGAIRSPGLANVTAFGQVPDGRRYRVMDALEGESLMQLLDRRGRLTPDEVADVLARIAAVLEATHAWAMAHGRLGPSSVFLHAGAVKLIDFGLAPKPVRPDDDLAALGAIGFTLLTGQEQQDGAPPPLGGGIPELLDRLLRELLERRVASATEARKELDGLKGMLNVAPAPATSASQLQPVAPPPRRGVVLLVIALSLAAAGTVVAILAPRDAPAAIDVPSAPDAAEGPTAPVADSPDAADAMASAEPADAGDALQDEQDEPDAAVAEVAAEPPTKKKTRRGGKTSAAPKPPPTVKALQDEVSRLEAKLRKHAKSPDDIEQALYMLNKQRLRLTGNVTEADRTDVARQLALWQRSYLRR